jgi:hypothetical protein
MKSFLVLIILANLAYFAWREGYTGDLLPPPAVYTEVPTVPAFVQAENRLQLLQELPEAAEVPATAVEMVETPVVPDESALVSGIDEEPIESIIEPPALVAWCGQVTGFADDAAAQSFVSGLPEGFLIGGIQKAEVPVSSTWWVHMPAFESEALALRMLEELQDNNIDSYYMRSGELKGGISLGVFSRQESALTAQSQLARRGYATSIAEVFRVESRPVLQLRLPGESYLESPEWLALMDNRDDLQLTENACEIIAPPPQFP